MPVMRTSPAGLVHLALIKHHLEDVYKGLERGSMDLADASLEDIDEILKSLRGRDRVEAWDQYGEAVLFARIALNFAHNGIRWGW